MLPKPTQASPARYRLRTSAPSAPSPRPRVAAPATDGEWWPHSAARWRFRRVRCPPCTEWPPAGLPVQRLLDWAARALVVEVQAGHVHADLFKGLAVVDEQRDAGVQHLHGDDVCGAAKTQKIHGPAQDFGQLPTQPEPARRVQVRGKPDRRQVAIAVSLRGVRWRRAQGEGEFDPLQHHPRPRQVRGEDSSTHHERSPGAPPVTCAARHATCPRTSLTLAARWAVATLPRVPRDAVHGSSGPVLRAPASANVGPVHCRRDESARAVQ